MYVNVLNCANVLNASKSHFGSSQWQVMKICKIPPQPGRKSSKWDIRPEGWSAPDTLRIRSWFSTTFAQENLTVLQPETQRGRASWSNWWSTAWTILRWISYDFILFSYCSYQRHPKTGTKISHQQEQFVSSHAIIAFPSHLCSASLWLHLGGLVSSFKDKKRRKLQQNHGKPPFCTPKYFQISRTR